MNWTRAVLAGVAGGVAAWIANFVMHGMILASTYMKHEVFTQEQANPAYFLLIGICIGIPAAVLFAKTRDSWSGGLTGGATFGFFLGLVAYFDPFYNALVIEGFPYYLSWCWGAVNLIGFVVYGAVIGAVYRSG